MLDCLLVSAIMFYMYKAKNMNGRRNIFTLVVRVHCPLLLRQRRQSIYRIQLRRWTMLSCRAAVRVTFLSIIRWNVRRRIAASPASVPTDWRSG